MDFDQIRSLAAGFQPARLLFTTLELGVFDALAAGPRDAAGVAAELDLDPRATAISLRALAALGFLERDGEGRYHNAQGLEVLVRDAPGYRGEILRHLGDTWEDWSGFTRVWRTGRPALERKTQQLPSSPEGLRHFVLGMENVTRDLAPRIAGLLPLDRCRKALDLGGGPGNYALAFVQRAPELRVVHFDLPETSRIAREFVSGQDRAERVSFLEGDFLRDPLGGGYDLVWASQIIHILGEDDLRVLVRRLAPALVPGGLLAIHDQFLDADEVSPRSAALFGVHMLVATRGGRTYSLTEVEEWLAEVGIVPEGRLDYGGPSRILLARRGAPR